MPAKKVAIITEIPFWRQFAGHTARLSSMIDYLMTRFDLTVIFGGLVNTKELKEYRENSKIKIVPFNLPKFGPANFADFVKRLMYAHHFESCIIEFIELSYLLDAVPGKTKKYLDTHDLKSKRENEFARVGLKHEKFTWKEEVDIFRQYDKVMLIQKPDFLKVSKIIGKKKTLYVPHAVRFPKQRIRREVEKVGFVASSYPLNIEGLNWFLNKVWCNMDIKNCRLNIYGSICAYSNYFKKFNNVSFVGPYSIPDSVYSNVDILINPVRLGSGLKIKNIEALGNGIPLITSEHGAVGLEEIADAGFIIASDSNDFRNKLEMLIGDYDLRQTLSETAYNYISEFFSPENCYGPLERSICEL